MLVLAICAFGATVALADTTPLLVTVSRASGQANPTSVSPVNFTIVFSRPVDDFTSADVIVSGTAAATTVIITGSGDSYNVAVSGMIWSGTVVVGIPSNVAHDSDGNGNLASTNFGNVVNYVFHAENPFAGDYSGTYKGSESGIWTGTVASDGAMNVIAISPSVGIFRLSGTVSFDGDMTADTSGSGTLGNLTDWWEGSFHMDGSDVSGSGSWTSSSGYWGTWTGARLGSRLPPTVTVTSPSDNPYATGSRTVSISGTASSDPTSTLSSVTWENSAGGTGSCDGTTSWSADVPLQPGQNVITITAVDDGGQTGVTMVTVYVMTTIRDAKMLPDGSAVYIDHAVVSASFSDRFYIQQPDRACGIEVIGTSVVGQRVSIVGTIYTGLNGERYIAMLGWGATPGTVPVAPLGMSNRALGGGDCAYDAFSGAGQQGIAGCSGLNNIGLLVRTWGKVTLVGRHPGWFYIDDGSGIRDGTGNVGIYVDAPGMSVPALGSFVGVTGISSCEYYNGQLVNVLIELPTPIQPPGGM